MILHVISPNAKYFLILTDHTNYSFSDGSRMINKIKDVGDDVVRKYITYAPMLHPYMYTSEPRNCSPEKWSLLTYIKHFIRIAYGIDLSIDVISAGMYFIEKPMNYESNVLRSDSVRKALSYSGFIITRKCVSTVLNLNYVHRESN